MFVKKSQACVTAYFLGGLASSLVCASVLGQIMSHVSHHSQIQGILSTTFNVDREWNVPSAFSALLLLAAAGLLLTISFSRIKQKLSVGYWLVLTFGFAFMSADEMFSFHERLINPIRNLLKNLLNVEHLGFFNFAWVIPGIVLVSLLIPLFWTFVMKLPRPTRRNFITAACLYLSGAIGIELLGGYVAALSSTSSFFYNMVATVEESLEMSGVIVFIHGLMVYLSDLPATKESASGSESAPNIT